MHGGLRGARVAGPTGGRRRPAPRGAPFPVHSLSELLLCEFRPARLGGQPVEPDLRPRGRAVGGRGEGRTELRARSSLCAGKFSTLSPPTRFLVRGRGRTARRDAAAVGGGSRGGGDERGWAGGGRAAGGRALLAFRLFCDACYREAACTQGGGPRARGVHAGWACLWGL